MQVNVSSKCCGIDVSTLCNYDLHLNRPLQKSLAHALQRWLKLLKCSSSFTRRAPNRPWCLASQSSIQGCWNELLTVWLRSRHRQKLQGTEYVSLVSYEYASFTIWHLCNFSSLRVWLALYTSRSAPRGIDTITYKIYTRDPSFPMSASSVPRLCLPPKALCSCITLPVAIVPFPPVAETKQILETTLKTSWENKLPLKVILPLTLVTALCFTSKEQLRCHCDQKRKLLNVLFVGRCFYWYM